MKVLVINPGSTSTKIAVFENENTIFEHKLDHAAEADFQANFAKSRNVFDQFEYRLDKLNQVLEQNKIDQLDAVVGRGGMLPPLTSGTYRINDKMVEALMLNAQAQHASNLGAPLALEIARKYKVSENAFIVDPVTTDEIEEKHKITGIPGIKRYAAWHALNQKSVSRQYAKDIGKKYEELNLIVAHLGGGFSFGAHRKGRTVNVYNALSGEGPFTPERAGYIPAQSLVEMCFSGNCCKEEIMYQIAGGGGLFAHLGTKNLMDLENNYPSLCPHEKDVVDEMFAGISRSICSLIPDFEGEKIDQILLTGGVVRWKLLVEKVKNDLYPLGIGISTYPGEKELEALRDGAIRVLKGEEKAKEY